MSIAAKSATAVWVVMSVGSLVGFGQPVAKKANPHAQIPASGFAVVSVNIDQLYRSEAFQPFREQAGRLRDELKANGSPFTVFTTDTVERASFFWISPPLDVTVKHFAAVYQLNTSKKPIDVKRMLIEFDAIALRDFARPRDNEKEKPPVGLTDPNGIYFADKLKRWFVIADDRTVLFMPEFSGRLDGLLETAALYQNRISSPLDDAMSLADRHTVVVGVNLPLMLDGMFPLKAKQVKDAAPFVSAVKLTATADIDKSIRVTATASFATEDDAKKAETALQELIRTGTAELNGLRTEFAANSDAKEIVPALTEAALAALEKCEAKRAGTEITMRAEINLKDDTKKALGRFPDWLKKHAEEQITINSLKQLGIAAQAHSDATGQLPKDITDEDGKPLLSWRVELLPYLEREDLYRKIDRTKPWDDPVHQPLHVLMPKQFEIRTRPAKEKGHTYFVAPRSEKWTGKGDPWLVNGKKITLDDLKAWDGLENTVVLIEGESSINWMKPGDLEFDPKKMPRIGDPKSDGVYAAFWDYNARRLKRSELNDDTLRAILTVNGGEKVPPPKK